MVLWFVGVAVIIVWAVFRDPAIDYRVVMAGVLVPDVVDGIVREIGLGLVPLHTLAGGALVLSAVMLATRGRRHARRRWLALPIGIFIHLLLDGVWTRTELFAWPLFGWSVADHSPLPWLDRAVPVVVAQEVIGAAALAWAWWRFRLGESERRRAFARTGRLGRDVRA